MFSVNPYALTLSWFYADLLKWVCMQCVDLTNKKIKFRFLIKTSSLQMKDDSFSGQGFGVAMVWCGVDGAINLAVCGFSIIQKFRFNY